MNHYVDYLLLEIDEYRIVRYLSLCRLVLNILEFDGHMSGYGVLIFSATSDDCVTLVDLSCYIADCMCYCICVLLVPSCTLWSCFDNGCET